MKTRLLVLMVGMVAGQACRQVDQKEILSITDTLYFGDTLKIKFKIPHSRDIAISTPDSIHFFLSLDSLLIPSLELFATSEQLEIVTNKTKSVPYVYGATERVLIFDKSGIYQII